MKRYSFRRVHAVVITLTAAIAAGLLSTAPLAQTRAFAWKATKGTGAVYLVGSVHMLTSDFYPLPASLEAGYKDSDLLVEEANLAEMLSPNMQFSMLSRGMLPAGQTLDKVISPATMALLDKHTSALGMPVVPLKQFKP